MSPLRFFILVALLGGAASGTGCDVGKPNEEHISKVKDAFDKIATTSDEALKDLKSSVNTDEPLEELKKLRQFEYKVLAFSGSTSAAMFETELSGLGKAFWDCFHIERSTDTGEFLVFCKRRRETPLQYVPQSILGR